MSHQIEEIGNVIKSLIPALELPSIQGFITEYTRKLRLENDLKEAGFNSLADNKSTPHGEDNEESDFDEDDEQFFAQKLIKLTDAMEFVGERNGKYARTTFVKMLEDKQCALTGEKLSHGRPDPKGRWYVHGPSIKQY
jgi:hypothetical protein